MKRTYASGWCPSQNQLYGMLSTLPPGCRRVALALVADPNGTTYPAVAARLGIHLGTVHRQLRRIRLHHPSIYRALMRARSSQLAKRHKLAVVRHEEHTARWRAWQRANGGFF